jgi:branched-subunit amino acid ABC-type transport system permease component
MKSMLSMDGAVVVTHLAEDVVVGMVIVIGIIHLVIRKSRMGLRMRTIKYRTRKI